MGQLDGTTGAGDLCSAGRLRRYCCVPGAWRNLREDFGEDALRRDGHVDLCGEPLDPWLCEVAAGVGVDPHDVFGHPDFRYEPSRGWWPEHVHRVVSDLVRRRGVQ